MFISYLLQISPFYFLRFDARVAEITARPHWSERLRTYFTTHIVNDFKTRASRWYLEAINCPNSQQGITTNAAESINNQLKEFRCKKNPIKTYDLIVRLNIAEEHLRIDVQKGFFSQVIALLIN